MKTAAIYARVSSDKQREENTIASQTSALIAFAREQNCDVPAEWVIEDDGYSGASLLRPGLERLRDLAAEGLIQVALVYAPDRLSRRYAHQILLIEEFARAVAHMGRAAGAQWKDPDAAMLTRLKAAEKKRLDKLKTRK